MHIIYLRNKINKFKLKKKNKKKKNMNKYIINNLTEPLNSKKAENNSQRINLTFKNLTYSVKTKNGNKQILKSISGECKSG